MSNCEPWWKCHPPVQGQAGHLPQYVLAHDKLFTPTSMCSSCVLVAGAGCSKFFRSTVHALARQHLAVSDAKKVLSGLRLERFSACLSIAGMSAQAVPASSGPFRFMCSQSFAKKCKRGVYCLWAWLLSATGAVCCLKQSLPYLAHGGRVGLHYGSRKPLCDSVLRVVTRPCAGVGVA